MTFETDSEVEGVWSRVSYYISTTEINSVTQDGMAQQIKFAMENPKPSMAARGGMDRLVDAGYPEVAAKNEKIKSQLLEQRIQTIQIRGHTRFMAKKGTVDGMALGGVLLKGTNLQEAIRDLAEKGKEPKKRRLTYARKKGYSKTL